MLKWFAPILSFTTEEIYTLVNKNNSKSIHLEQFPDIPSDWSNNNLEKKWEKLITIRNACNISIEEKRSSKEIGSSLEANLEINLNKNFTNIVKGTDFSEICITSGAEIKFGDIEDIKVQTTKAEGNKCPSCWKITKKSCSRKNCAVNKS